MINIYPDPETLARAVAEEFVEHARRAILERGRFTVALAGGTTPKRAYELLAQPHLAHQIEWGKVLVFFGDERNVAATDPDSNEKMARETLLSHVPVPEEQIFPMYQTGDAEANADDYARVLRQNFEETIPKFDLVMLGMGPDGHTASLFPGTDALESDDVVLAATSPVLGVSKRISLGRKVLQSARLMLFSAAGAEKADRIREVLEDESCNLPSAVVWRGAGAPSWFLDAGAASKLSGSGNAW